MSLHGIAAFSKCARRLPAVTLHEQWGSHVAKVGGKVFALISDDGAAIAFKVTELSFEGLTALEGIGQAPYFAKRQWVSVARGAALRDAELKAYIAAAHAMIAARLTRRLRAELGLDRDSTRTEPHRP
jgi:predicted DNA-binding protein (MmcQ/YjbR family)